jgi:hypothetical protein
MDSPLGAEPFGQAMSVRAAGTGWQACTYKVGLRKSARSSAAGGEKVATFKKLRLSPGAQACAH